MNVPTILCFAVLFVSNIALWGVLLLQLEWDNNTDEQLDVLYERDKGMYEAIKLHKYEHKMKENSMYGLYVDTDSAKEGESNDN